MMGLRLVEGVELERITALGAQDWQHSVKRPALDRMVAQGLASLDDTRLMLTADGRQRLNSVLADLLI